MGGRERPVPRGVIVEAWGRQAREEGWKPLGKAKGGPKQRQTDSRPGIWTIGIILCQVVKVGPLGPVGPPRGEPPGPESGAGLVVRPIGEPDPEPMERGGSQ